MKASSRKPFPVDSIAIRDDGDAFAYAGGSLGQPCPVVLSNFANKPTENVLQCHEKSIIGLAFRSDKELISCSFDSHLCRWSSDGDLIRANELRTEHRVDGFSVTSDERHVITGAYNGELTVFDIESFDPVSSFRIAEQANPIWSVACQPNSDAILVGDSGGRICCWDLVAASPRWTVELGWGHHVWGLSWFRAGDRFVVCSHPDGAAEPSARSQVSIRDANDGVVLASFYPGGPQPYCCSLSRDERYIAAAGGRTDRGGKPSRKNCTVHLWDVAQENTAAVLTGHSQLVRSVAFTTDSKRLLSGGQDRTLRCWDLDSAIKEADGT